MTHITTIDNATVYYWDSEAEDIVRCEGSCEIHDHWVKLPDTLPVWIPREQVEQVMAR